MPLDTMPPRIAAWLEHQDRALAVARARAAVIEACRGVRARWLKAALLTLLDGLEVLVKHAAREGDPDHLLTHER